RRTKDACDHRRAHGNDVDVRRADAGPIRASPSDWTNGSARPCMAGAHHIADGGTADLQVRARTAGSWIQSNSRTNRSHSIRIQLAALAWPGAVTAGSQRPSNTAYSCLVCPILDLARRPIWQ